MSRRAERRGQVELIRASAGTGKTFQLSNRYLKLLMSGVQPERILASTFTRKAAGEILDRIIQRLARAACHVEQAEELADKLHRPDLGRHDFEQKLAEFLKGIDRCRISTLDAYFGQIARTNCLELGLSASWSILDESDDAEIRQEAIRRTLSEGFAGELIHLLAKGETKRAVGQLVQDTIKGLYPFLVDSDPEAWERLPELSSLSDSQIAELREQLQGIPVSGRAKTAVEKDLKAIAEGDWKGMFKAGFLGRIAAGETSYYKQELDPSLVEIYRSLLRHVVAVRVRQDRQHLQGAHQLLSTFHRHYEELKRQARALRFDDVTRAIDRGWAEIVSQGKERQEHAMEHVLLDEFQDTSPIQWRVLRPQVTRALSRSNGSLMVVGDTKQAIYGWRGGDARLFDAIEAEFVGDQATRLSDSWRSTPQVLNAVNCIFETAQQCSGWENFQQAVAQWTAGFPKHEAVHASRKGFVQLVGAGDPFQAAVDAVTELHTQAPHVSIALLVRQNDDVDRLVSMLAARGVSASEESGKKIGDSRAVRIILSALHMVDHPDSDPERVHVACTPLGEAWELEPYAERHEQRGKAHRLAARLRQQLVHDGYGPTIEQWCAYLLPVLEARERRRLAQLVDLAFAYESRATLRTMDFIRFVENETVSDPSSAMVRVMNYHQAKGLEFDAVFLPDLDRRWISHYPSFVSHRPDLVSRIDGIAAYVPEALRSWMPEPLGEWTQGWIDETISEGLSILYVALTRAAWALHLFVKATDEAPTLSTFGGLIVTALADGGPIQDGQVIHEGDENWWKSVDIEAEQEEEARVRMIPQGPICFAPSDPRRSRSIPSVSPSSREGGSKIPISQWLRQGKPENLIRGTVVHALFETVKWRDQVPSEPQLRARIEALEEKPADIDGTIRDFLDWIRGTELRQVLDRQAQLQWAQKRWPQTHRKLGGIDDLRVVNEYRFTLFEERPQGLVWCSGSVDRLTTFGGDDPVAAVIDDYKTDRIEGLQQQHERVEHYRPQLEAYRSAVAQSLGLTLEQVAARLIFVEIDRLVEVF